MEKRLAGLLVPAKASLGAIMTVVPTRRLAVAYKQQKILSNVWTAVIMVGREDTL